MKLHSPAFPQDDEMAAFKRSGATAEQWFALDVQTRAYFRWREKHFKGQGKLPLAAAAWHAAIEYMRGPVEK